MKTACGEGPQWARFEGMILSFTGADKIEREDGDLILTGPGRALRFQSPHYRMYSDTVYPLARLYADHYLALPETRHDQST